MENSGRITLPVEENMGYLLTEIVEKWGADAVRNSDGTQLPENIKEMGLEVYSTLSLTRADQEWASAHEDQLTQKFLISDPVTAFSDVIEIDIMKGHFNQQFKPDDIHDIKKWFEVYDRTTGEPVPVSKWSYDKRNCVVKITDAMKYHVYTVSFLAYQIWDTTSMYNYVTNKWIGTHVRPLDPLQPETRAHLIEYLKKWLDDNPDTDVVRLTSLAYHFTNNFQEIDGGIRSRYRDWIGYHDCTSALALEKFEEEYGYALKPENIVTEGYMSDVNMVPSKMYLDWMDFIQRTVTDIAKEWVSIIHAHGRKAMMFYCDHWIGAEPYGKYFSNIGLDAIVNPCMCGVELRRIADIPVTMIKEARLYPYFFPVNLEGKPSFPDGNPVDDCKKYWKNIRRAIVQNPVDRIGFGGYLSLAVKRPDFIDYVSELANEFRQIHAISSNYESIKAPFKVGILNCWGSLRSWIDDDINDWTKPYRGGIQECLSGMNVSVSFISFEDIIENGIPEDIKVLINTGDANTSWSGGYYWKNEKLVTTIRQWVYETGGGFIGVQNPSAFQFQGHFFQLFDVLGVDRELGYGKSAAKLPFSTCDDHFVLEDGVNIEEMKNKANNVFVNNLKTQVLLSDGDNVLIATNTYGNGRALYISDLKYSEINIRVLLRSLYWVTGCEDKLKTWYSSNPFVEVTAFRGIDRLILLNNSFENQKTRVFNDTGNFRDIEMKPFVSIWFEFSEFK